jgi:hypothetical protein
MLDANAKIQKLDGDLKEIKNEYKEYRIENENNKRDAKRFEEECTALKAEVAKLTASNQKLFSDLMESRKQLHQQGVETKDLLDKVQMEYEDLNVNYQKSVNSEAQYRT